MLVPNGRGKDEPLDLILTQAAASRIVTDPEWLKGTFNVISEATSVDEMTVIGQSISAQRNAGTLNPADEARLSEVYMPKWKDLIAKRNAQHQADQQSATAEA